MINEGNHEGKLRKMDTLISWNTGETKAAYFPHTRDEAFRVGGTDV
jgi:hypothetical protein